MSAAEIEAENAAEIEAENKEKGAQNVLLIASSTFSQSMEGSRILLGLQTCTSALSRSTVDVSFDSDEFDSSISTENSLLWLLTFRQRVDRLKAQRIICLDWRSILALGSYEDVIWLRRNPYAELETFVQGKNLEPPLQEGLVSALWFGIARAKKIAVAYHPLRTDLMCFHSNWIDVIPSPSVAGAGAADHSYAPCRLLVINSNMDNERLYKLLHTLNGSIETDRIDVLSRLPAPVSGSGFPNINFYEKGSREAWELPHKNGIHLYLGPVSGTEFPAPADSWVLNRLVIEFTELYPTPTTAGLVNSKNSLFAQSVSELLALLRRVMHDSEYHELMAASGNRMYLEQACSWERVMEDLLR